MRIRYTEPALFELNASISYFLRVAPSVVSDFTASIDKALAQVLEHPYSAQETEMPGIRRISIRRFRYLVFYTVEGDEIVVLHVRHGARQRPWEEQ
jgi:toxin ParE1/3/4